MKRGLKNEKKIKEKEQKRKNKDEIQVKRVNIYKRTKITFRQGSKFISIQTPPLPPFPIGPKIKDKRYLQNVCKLALGPRRKNIIFRHGGGVRLSDQAKTILCT
jgi:hypothetical protein